MPRRFGPLTAGCLTAVTALGLYSLYRLLTTYATLARKGFGHGADSGRFWDSTFSVFFVVLRRSSSFLVVGRLALAAAPAVRDRRARQKGSPR